MKNDPRFESDDKREEALKTVISDMGSCPLRIRHPPNGIEFGMGCGLCRGVETVAAKKSTPPPVPVDGQPVDPEAEAAAKAEQEVLDCFLNDDKKRISCVI